MRRCTHIQKIRRSMCALVLLFALSLLVLGSSFVLFDAKFKTVMPQSMQDKRIEYNGLVLPVFLIFVAGVGMPLGWFVFSTLAACEKKENGTRKLDTPL